MSYKAIYKYVNYSFRNKYNSLSYNIQRKYIMHETYFNKETLLRCIKNNFSKQVPINLNYLWKTERERKREREALPFTLIFVFLPASQQMFFKFSHAHSNSDSLSFIRAISCLMRIFILIIKFTIAIQLWPLLGNFTLTFTCRNWCIHLSFWPPSVNMRVG